MTDAEAFGQRVAQERREKAARERRDITQTDVATALNTTAATVSRWESGLAIPGDAMLGKLADYFGVRRSWLRWGEEPRATADPVFASIPVDTTRQREIDRTRDETARKPARVRRKRGA